MLLRISMTVVSLAQIPKNFSKSLRYGTIVMAMENYSTRLSSVSKDKSQIKIGLEATGHYSYNILGSLLDHGYHTFVINPLHTNLYRKGQSLRKTKTDKVDARSIAEMLVTDKTLKPYTGTSYHTVF